MKNLLCVAASAAALMASAGAMAAEGMWLPSQTPALGATLKKAGLKIDPAALGDLQKAPLNAIVSIGGCSAAFVSPDGLVATNHHCVVGSVQYNSKPGANYLEDGFLAAELKDEVPTAPGTRVYVIEKLDDVTAGIMNGVSAGMSGFDRNAAIEKNRKALVSACEQQANRRCDVRAYFGGAQYWLQQMLEIKDVRLVYAPAGGVGNFGGEIDNWQWPRHTGDFGFYRAYVAPDGSSAAFDVKNVPYKPKSHLAIAKTGIKAGDFVMLAGFPGATDRLRTAAEADFYYATFYPKQQQLLTDYSDAIMRATAGNEAATIKYASILRGADNIKKKLLGQLQGADSVSLSSKKAAAEKDFRDWAVAEPARKARLEPVIGALDAVLVEQNAGLSADQRFGLLNRAQLLSAARTALRWSQERAKPDADREEGFQDRDRRFVTERLTAIERRFDPAVDSKLFEQALGEYRALPADKRDAAFDKKLAEIGLDKLYAATALGDTKTRLGWLDKTPADFAASKDPFVQLALALSPGDMAREQRAKDRAGRVQAARSAYVGGMLEHAAATGKTLYPDANGSLRFTYGEVTGRARDGMIWTPFTTAEGVLAKDTGKDPFNSPKKLLERIKAKDYGAYAEPSLKTLPVNYLSTLDITNGNSGSATLNAKGEFVGLAFDGTLDGVISDWWYEAPINRTIHVDSRYMLWTMDKVDGAGRLLKEMGVK